MSAPLPPSFSFHQPLTHDQLNQLRAAILELQGLPTPTLAGLGIANIQPGPQTYTAYGDSITFGYNASSPANSYVGLLGASLGLTPANYGIPGTQAADQAALIYPTANPSTTGTPLYTLMVGVNDAYFWNVNYYKQQAFLAMHGAITAFLATPIKTRAQAAGITYSGAWTNSGKYGGTTSRQTSVQNASATFSAYGPVVYVATTMETGGTATFDVYVDAVYYNSYSAGPPGGVSVTTLLGATYGSALLRLTGLTETLHSIEIRKTSSAADTLTLDWVASAAGQNWPGGVQVVVGGNTRGNVTDPNGATYLAMVKQSVQRLAGDGLPVTFADTAGFLLPADIAGDGTHPLDSGHAKLRDAFLAAVNGQARGGMWRTAASQIFDAFGDSVIRGSAVIPTSQTFAGVVGGGDGHAMNGAYNVITGGRYNAVEGYFNTVTGYDNAGGGGGTFIAGQSATDRLQPGILAFSSGKFASRGDAQRSLRMLRGATTNATVTRITADAAAASAVNTVNLPNLGTYRIRLEVAARQTGGASGTVGDSAEWEATVLVKRGANAAATTFVSGRTLTSTPALAAVTAGTAFAPGLRDTAAAAWRLTLAADTTNGGLAVSVTGEASKNIAWLAAVLAVELVG